LNPFTVKQVLDAAIYPADCPILFTFSRFTRIELSMFERITLPNNLLPPPAPYSHAVRAGDFLFVTGQLAQIPNTNDIHRGDIAAQTRQVMENLKLVLTHANTGFDRVAMARIFLTDMRDYATVNDIYASYFPAQALPGRTTVGVLGLAGQGDVEIDLIVYCGT
jgi:2-iminobutanoate/2-iminopropanoate deaminase